MTFTPRGYQQAAINAAIDELRRTTDPILIEAATGAGKSVIVAHLARHLHTVSQGKRVLCLAPSKELTLQNAAKMKAIGERLSIFSASAGAKSTRHPIVFGTPGTVKNAISRFTNGDYCAVIVDEAHGITPTIRAIIEAMQATNPRLRVIGMTATPFRLGTGYIYRQGPDGRVNGDDTCREPFFMKSVARIGARDLIEQGYLTPPIIGTHEEGYDTSGLILKPNGHFDDASVDAAFVGHGRKTATIVADVVRQAAGRKGVVFFAATIQHAQEVLASLPPEKSAIVTGQSADRAGALARFDRQEIKYLVNVNVLTVGWDAPHVDVIAILRRTESVGLLQQIIGRGLRTSPGKDDVLILDYAANLETHCPDGDLFSPIVKARGAKEGGGAVPAECPSCGYANEFSLHPNADGYQLDANGYCVDVWGARIETDFGPLPGHYGRRCLGLVRVGAVHERCAYRWTSKPCPACDEPNDIAARYCSSCKAEIVDPGEKLAVEFKAFKRDPTQPQTDTILSMDVKESVSQRGNPTVRVDFKTPYRQFSVWFSPESQHARPQKDWQRFEEARKHGQPETVSYMKERDSQFYRVLAYGQPIDEIAA